MTKKCELCNEKIEEDEMGKINGTIVKIKNSDNKNDFKYVCNDCQKNKEKFDNYLLEKKKNLKK